ncbi:MAG: hypothetical protein LC790_19005, partial [Actinobacteria bacterium]|nr:hypothetical protein [Actinomycetota bacterium]
MATISSLLADHVTLRVRSVDRIFLAGYVSSLQSEGLLVRFLLGRAAAAGGTIPSPALLGEMGQRYVKAIDAFAADHKIAVVRFEKGARKEDVARPFLEAAERDGRHGVVMIGVAQEKAYAWKGRRQGGSDAHPHFVFARQAVFVNHYYFYIRDPDWGHGFIKANAYAPFPVWVYLNGHEWAKAQAARSGMDFRAMDNGFRSCVDEQALAAICDTLCHTHVLGFFERWMGVLPSPFSADERRRHPYRLSVRQIEVSDTRVFDPPAAARGWFEQTIRDQLDLGRPDNVQIVFARKITNRTPGRFQTKVIHRGVQPVIQAHYKHSKVKQYLKDGRALRTETTVNDPYDFNIKRTLTAETWQQLTAIGEQVNERLMDHELAARQCAPDPAALQAVVLPSTVDGQPAPGLRFGDPRVMALLACLSCWAHLFEGFTNRGLRELVADLIPGYDARQMTYDLRRLRRKGLIQRVARSRRYVLTDHGRMIAVFFTKTHTR